MPIKLTIREQQYCSTIQAKDESLRKLLDGAAFNNWHSPGHLFHHLTSIKDALGNLNNDISFVATLLAKNYLVSRFDISDFDAAPKPQGAPGIDIEVTTQNALSIVGEIKTTNPYQPGFGAKQKETIHKDMKRLNETSADHRFMFVTNHETFKILCGDSYRSKYPLVEVVDLINQETAL